jgi:hypothetical protein
MFGMDAVVTPLLSITNQLDPRVLPLTMGSVAWDDGVITCAKSGFYSLHTRSAKTDLEKARHLIGAKIFGGQRHPMRAWFSKAATKTAEPRAVSPVCIELAKALNLVP